VNFKEFITESWKTYKVSNSPKVLLYDFYLLSYISSLILDPGTRKDVGLTGVGYSGKFFGREGKDLDEDIQYAQRQLLPFLGTKLSQALFIAICAELRHVEDRHQDWKEFKHVKNKTFRNYIRNYTLLNNRELQPFHSRRNLEQPELKANQKGYITSYKAAKKAIKETGGNTIDFALMAADAFRDLTWTQAYGGPKWAEISEGYVQLRRALDNYNPEAPSPTSASAENLIAAIDHAFDLEHNTGSVLNKVAYFGVKEEGASDNYRWIKNALDLKKDASMYEIAKRASSDMRKLGLEVLKVAGLQEKQMKQVSAEAGIPKKVVKLQGFGKKPETTKAAFLIGDEVEVKNVDDVKGVVISFTQTPNGILYSVKVTNSEDDLYLEGDIYNLYGEKLTKVEDKSNSNKKTSWEILNPHLLDVGSLIKDKIGEPEFVAQIINVNVPKKNVMVRVIAVKDEKDEHELGKTYNYSFENISNLFNVINKSDEDEFLKDYIVDHKQPYKPTKEKRSRNLIGNTYVLTQGIVVKVLDIEGNQVLGQILAFKGNEQTGYVLEWPLDMFESLIELKVKDNEVEKYVKRIKNSSAAEQASKAANADQPAPREDGDDPIYPGHYYVIKDEKFVVKVLSTTVSNIEKNLTYQVVAATKKNRNYVGSIFNDNYRNFAKSVNFELSREDAANYIEKFKEKR